MQTKTPTRTTLQKKQAGQETNTLQYIKLNDPKLLLRWSLDKYKFIKVEIIQVRV